MKKIMLIGFLAIFGWVVTSQAVVISWSSEQLLTGENGTTSAQLVYVSGGTAPTYSTPAGWSAGASSLATASGGAIDGSYLWDQTTTHAQQSQGNYYVVLFNSANGYKVSDNSLTYNDAKLGTSEFDPATTFYATFEGGTWDPVPEPSVATLLLVGVAAAVLRRRKRA